MVDKEVMAVAMEKMLDKRSSTFKTEGRYVNTVEAGEFLGSGFRNYLAGPEGTSNAKSLTLFPLSW